MTKRKKLTSGKRGPEVSASGLRQAVGVGLGLAERTTKTGQGA